MFGLKTREYLRVKRVAKTRSAALVKPSEKKLRPSKTRGEKERERDKREKEMGEEKRHQMMQNLFGDQSEEEEEIDSEHESNPQPNYVSVSFLLQLFLPIAQLNGLLSKLFQCVI